ncbi:MAG: carboxypeptidase-like regulatory domain-containing protein [Acidobacteriia bacterium]|nr:carboxypeptidase-like regulatory domain-containing protein [Terriglobia bacterium]
MRHRIPRLLLLALSMAAAAWTGYAQGGGSSTSLNGTVIDQTGGVIPGAEVVVKNNATGAEAKAVTSENGTFSIPFLTPGTYTATVSVPNFKQAIIKEIVLVAGTPSAIRVTLEVGGSSETVTVQANAELVQSATANITATLNTTQLSSLPLSTRSAFDFLINLPGVDSTSGARNATVAGLPRSTVNITIDGINSQDNFLKGQIGGDGMFSMIQPLLDAIQEVTLSTATPGSEAAGQGAIQIKFVTRSGNNDYHGALYEYHQNKALNANSWFYNRDRNPTYDGSQDPCTTAQMQTQFDKCKAPRDRVIRNQFGFRLGGPISLPKRLFGPLGFNGRDRAFFFLNYEELREPQATQRTRTIFNPLVDQGIYPYTVGNTTQTVDLMALARANGQTSTFDPTVQKLLADIRAATTSTGTIKARTDPTYLDYLFANTPMSIRKAPTARFDLNLTNSHRLEGSWNFMQYPPWLDTLNSADYAFPGFPNFGTQLSNRYSTSIALRSTLTPRLVNELRFGMSAGSVLFWPEINAGQFTGTAVGNQDGFALGISAAGISNAYSRRNPERRNAPNVSLSETLSWSRSSHSFNFGASFTNVGFWLWDQNVVPSISFGVDSTYDPAYVMFNASNYPKNFPNASPSQVSTAQGIYAVLTGRVTQISGNAVLSETNNQYTYNGAQVQRGHMRELGFFAQDSWRMRPNFTFTYGARWELQLPFVPLNNMYSWNTVADLWGLTGPVSGGFGNGKLYTPGTLNGKAPTYNLYKSGDPAYNTSYHDVAPSIGFAWTPKGTGLLRRFLGENGQTVLRGGFSLAFNRPGMYDYSSMFGANPGMTINATRNVSNGNLVSGVGTDVWPLLFRDKSRLGPPPFASAPVYPIQSTSVSDQVNIFDPNTKTPYSLSWSFGVQRELTRDMALEVRYVATRNLQPWVQINVNEMNFVENGLLDEFKLAAANLQANMAAGRGNNFKYYGSGTGTSPLPITLAYFSGVPASQAGDTTKYTSSNFTSSTFVNTLAKYNPNPSSYGSNLQNDATRRLNALTAGLPANFFYVNPTVSSGGAWISTNSGFSRYESLVVELRRRLSRGLLVQASYTVEKGLQSSRLSFRTPMITVLNGGVMPQVFRVNWVYELPFGNGKMLLSGTHGVLERIVGGWEFQGIGRMQSGSLLNFGNVRLVGMTLQDLRGAVGLRFDDANKQIYYEPDDMLKNTIAAYNTSATTSTGYSAAFGVPTGRYISPANSGGCIQVVAGDCAPNTAYVRGPGFWNFDMSLAKKIRFTEQSNFEFRGEFINIFNNVNFNGTTCTSSSQTCGQVGGMQGSNRVIQLVARINF